MISYVNSNFLLKSNQIKEIFKRANTNDVFFIVIGENAQMFFLLYIMAELISYHDIMVNGTYGKNQVGIMYH